MTDLLSLVDCNCAELYVTAEVDDGDDMSDSGSQGDAALPRTDYSQLIVWQVYS